MKFLKIKFIVHITNILHYISLTLIFLFLGVKKWNINIIIIYNIIYFCIVFAILLFIIYHFLRIHELKKTIFQLTKKYILFMNIFYYTKYLIFILTLLYTILANISILNSKNICIFWYIWCPIMVLITLIVSILESIVRIEEKIFIIKDQWKSKKN